MVLIEKSKGRIVSLSGKMEGGEKSGLMDRLLQKTSGIFSVIGDIFKNDNEVNPHHFEITGEVDFDRIRPPKPGRLDPRVFLGALAGGLDRGRRRPAFAPP